MKRLIIASILLILTSSSIFAEDTIKLPKPDLQQKSTLMTALKDRQSKRNISSEELSLQNISNLLWAAFGVNRDDGRRTAPSAMDTQNISIYIAMNDGVYIYDAMNNSLEKTKIESKKINIKNEIGFQGFLSEAPVVLIYVADLSKSRGSEESRIYYAAMNTGYISQNVYLYCSANNLATVAVGWVKKDSLRKILDLNESQKIMLTQPVGHSK